jgi:hypothetical protein
MPNVFDAEEYSFGGAYGEGSDEDYLAYVFEDEELEEEDEGVIFDEY